MRRRGAILFAVLVCLLVVSALAVQLTRSVILHHRQLRTRQYESQSYWLANSACERAIARLRKDRDYSGETWSIAADELHGAHAAEAEIKIELIEGKPEKRRVVVEAVYPDAVAFRVTTRKEIVIRIHTQGDL